MSRSFCWISNKAGQAGKTGWKAAVTVRASHGHVHTQVYFAEQYACCSQLAGPILNCNAYATDTYWAANCKLTAEYGVLVGAMLAANHYPTDRPLRAYLDMLPHKSAHICNIGSASICKGANSGRVVQEVLSQNCTPDLRHSATAQFALMQILTLLYICGMYSSWLCTFAHIACLPSCAILAGETCKMLLGIACSPSSRMCLCSK